MIVLSIPIELCSFVLQNRIVNQFRSYVFLKSICSGKLPYDNKRLSTLLNISGKTLDKHLQKLRKLNWVGYNPKSNIIFIRGFDKIREMYQFNSRKAIVCTQTDFNSFRAFLFAAVVSNIIRYKKRQNWRFIASKKGYARQMNRQPFFYPLAVSYLAKLVNISNTSAARLKALSEVSCYLVTKENIKVTDISFKYFGFYRSLRDENRQYPKKTGETIGIQQPDLISTNLNFTRRKKMVTIKKGY